MPRDCLDRLYPCLLAISTVSGSLRTDCCWPAFLPFGQFIRYLKLLSPRFALIVLTSTARARCALVTSIALRSLADLPNFPPFPSQSSGQASRMPPASACTSLSPGSNSAQSMSERSPCPISPLTKMSPGSSKPMRLRRSYCVSAVETLKVP